MKERLFEFYTKTLGVNAIKKLLPEKWKIVTYKIWNRKKLYLFNFTAVKSEYRQLREYVTLIAALIPIRNNTQNTIIMIQQKNLYSLEIEKTIINIT